MSGEDAILGPDEILSTRPFTDPEHTRREAQVMRTMLERERERARAWETEVNRPGSIEQEHAEDQRRHLLVVPDPGALLQADGLIAVGFFGRPRDGVDHSILFELENELISHMADYAPVGLLSYYDIEFVKGAYGNLVLFSPPDVPSEWYANAVHRRAVQISPRHYHEVRLHKGSMPGRLLDGGEIAIATTKYFDFQTSSHWQGVRRFDLSGL